MKNGENRTYTTYSYYIGRSNTAGSRCNVHMLICWKGRCTKVATSKYKYMRTYILQVGMERHTEAPPP